MLGTIAVQSLREEYKRVASLTSAEVQDEYLHSRKDEMDPKPINTQEIQHMIKTLDSRGAWLKDLQIPHYPDVVGHPRRIVKGISTQTYVDNMEKFINYLYQLELED